MLTPPPGELAATVTVAVIEVSLTLFVAKPTPGPAIVSIGVVPNPVPVIVRRKFVPACHTDGVTAMTTGVGSPTVNVCVAEVVVIPNRSDRVKPQPPVVAVCEIV